MKKSTKIILILIAGLLVTAFCTMSELVGAMAISLLIALIIVDKDFRKAIKEK